MKKKKVDLDNEKTVQLISGRKKKKHKIMIASLVLFFIFCGMGIYVFKIPNLYADSGNLKKAAKAMENNEYDYSIAVLTKEIQVHKDDSSLYVERSTLYLKRAVAEDKEYKEGRSYSPVDRDNDFKAAAADADKALKLDSSSVSAWAAKKRVNMYHWYYNKKDPYSKTEAYEKEPVKNLPEKDQLDGLLVRLYCISKDKVGNLSKPFDSATLDEETMYKRIISDDMQLTSLYPAITYEPISADSKEAQKIKGAAASYVRISKEDAAWISSNIFNISESFQRDFREQNEKAKTIYTDAKNIYSGSNPIDISKWSVRYESAISDGEKYYIRYYIENEDEIGAHGYFFVTASLKEIGGKKYWSIYSNENKDPEGVDFPSAKKLKQAKKKSPQLPSAVKLLFSSGAGGWGTILNLNADGSFTGEYTLHNAFENVDQPFEGRFTNIQKINDFEYSMDLSYLSEEDVYGISGGNNFRLYLPGRSTADFSPQLGSWIKYAPNTGTGTSKIKSTLGDTVLYNCNEEYGFYEYNE